jgi:hypothetical protein
MGNDSVQKALRLALRARAADGGVPDEDSQEEFLRRELEGSAPQYDPEGGWRTAKEAGREIANLTTPGAIADAAGYLGGPSALENWKQGNKGTAALQVAGALPVVGPLAKGAGAAHLAMSMVPKSRAVEDALRVAREPHVSNWQDVKIGNSTGSYKDMGDHISLASIRTPQKYRGQGQASNVLRHINNVADELGKPVRLLASPLDKKTTTSGLVNFYKKHGYEITGETGNFVGDPWMERSPKNLAEQATEKEATNKNQQDLLNKIRELPQLREITEKRNRDLAVAAQHLGNGVTPEMYQELVNQLNPVRAYESVPTPATVEDLHRGLRANKHEKIGKGSEIAEGHPVGLRLDIPAYTDHGVWAPTIHDMSGQSPTTIAHEPAARVSNVSFVVPHKKALNVAQGANKAPFATINGGWVPTTAEEAHAAAIEALNHPDWRQVGMDPTRHSYFYDRVTQEPITHAEEVIQVGPLVLAKNPKYGKRKDYPFSTGGEVTQGTQMDDDIKNALRIAKSDEPKYDTGPQQGEAVMRSYEPSWKERFQNYLMGTDTAKPSPERRRFSEGVTDILSSAPGISNVLSGERLAAAMAAEDLPAAGAAAVGMIPGASGYVGKQALNVARNRLGNRAVEDALRLADRKGYKSGGTSKNVKGSVEPEKLGTLEPVEGYLNHYKNLDPQTKEEVMRRYNSLTTTPRTAPSIKTQRSTSPATPKFAIPPEEYQRGNLGGDKYALAHGGSVNRNGYAVGGAPTDLVAGTNPATATPQPATPYSSYVGSLYNNILGRQADPSGQQYWENQLNTGATTTQDMLNNFAGSQEYQNLYKSDPTKAVSGLYQAALDRTPEAEGLKYWTGQAQQGMNPNQIASQFASSPEFQNRNAIFNSYLNYTGEAPGAEQYASAQKALAQGKTLSDVTGEISQSPKAIQNLVGTAYQGLLGRKADPQGMQYWTDILNSGKATPQDLFNAMASSTEGLNYANEQTLNGLFMNTMGRAPKQEEQNKYLPDMAQNKITQDQLQQLLAKDPEAQNFQNQQLVNDTYQAFTGRLPTPKEINDPKSAYNDYMSKLAAGTLDPNSLAEAITSTPESKQYQLANNIKPQEYGPVNAKAANGSVPQDSAVLQDYFGQIETVGGLPKGTMLSMAGIESEYGTNQHRAGSQYEGMMQMGKKEQAKYGVKNPYNWQQNALGAARYMIENGKTFTKLTGQEPQRSDYYGMHQQGAGGWSKIVNNPNGKAAETLGYKNLINNLPNELRGQSSKMTNAQFRDFIQSKVNSKLQGPDGKGFDVLNLNPDGTTKTAPGSPATPKPGDQTYLNEYNKAQEQYQAAYNDWNSKTEVAKLQEFVASNGKSTRLPSWWPAPPTPPNKGQFAKDAYEKAVKQYQADIGNHVAKNYELQKQAQEMGLPFTPLPLKQPQPSDYGFEYNADNKNWAFTGAAPPPTPTGNIGQQLANQGAGGNVAGTGIGGNISTGAQPGVKAGATGNADLASSLAQQLAAQQAASLAQQNQFAKDRAALTDSMGGAAVAASRNDLQQYLNQTGAAGFAYLTGYGPPPTTSAGFVILPPAGYAVGGGGGGIPGVYNSGNTGSGITAGGGNFGVSYMNKGGVVGKALQLAAGGKAWTRKEGQNPEGGLNDKGRASLKAEGHDIKRPQPEGGARKDSFCARFAGMKKKLTSAETANDPDSRINKAMRKWDCADGGAVKKALDTALDATHPKALHHTLAETGYASGGEIWDKPRPKGLGKPKSLSASQKKSAKASAKAAGRPWPNLIDNLNAAKK